MDSGNVENKKDILKILMWSGSVMAAVAAIVYVSIVYVLVKGFEQSLEQNKLLLFVALGSSFGIFIVFSLRMQGIELARNEDISKQKLEEYNHFRAKEKKVKIRSIYWYITWKTIADIFTKGLTTAFFVYFSITIIIEGIHDEKYIALALLNVVFFIGMGLTQLAVGYRKYMSDHLVYLDKKINKMKENKNNELSKEIIRTSEDRFQRSERRGRAENSENENGRVGISSESRRTALETEGAAGEGLHQSSQESSSHD